jgi:hypothetical protein
MPLIDRAEQRSRVSLLCSRLIAPTSVPPTTEVGCCGSVFMRAADARYRPPRSYDAAQESRQKAMPYGYDTDT